MASDRRRRISSMDGRSWPVLGGDAALRVPVVSGRDCAGATAAISGEGRAAGSCGVVELVFFGRSAAAASSVALVASIFGAPGGSACVAGSGGFTAGAGIEATGP